MIRSFLAPKNHWPPNEAWTYHIQRGHANLPHHEQHLNIAGAVFGPIDSLETYVKHGQALHAEMMRAEFESARRDRPNNGGTMMWMFNDCWPTSNWSIIDYTRRPKPSYFAAKRAAAPLLPIVCERGGAVEFFSGNDSLETSEMEVEYGLRRLYGAAIWIRKIALCAPRNGTVRFARLGREDDRREPGDHYFIDAAVAGRRLFPAAYFPDGWKDIAWPADPGIQVAVDHRERRGEHHLTGLTVTTRRFARFLHLRGKDEAAGAEFSDNYFDLPAGMSWQMEIRSAMPVEPEGLLIGHWKTTWE